MFSRACLDRPKYAAACLMFIKAGAMGGFSFHILWRVFSW